MKDAASVWHVLDIALRKICEARDSLAEAGLDEFAEGIQEVVGPLEVAYAAAEEKLAETTEDDPPDWLLAAGGTR